MNDNSLHQIFLHYTENIESLTSRHLEYYKWQICEKFPCLMKKALDADKEEFATALSAVKKCTENLIDSYTQPMAGLVDIARCNGGEDAMTVQKILKDLYTDDGGDLRIRMEIISDYFKRCEELLEKHFPGSYRYRQNSHSVSALLFLNDPDHHYMFKASHCRDFADCVEFYDSWGTGDNIKLDVFHRMCDELVEAIKNCPELLATNASRFDKRLNLPGGPLHPDTEKHILAFDIIYCCSTYDLYKGISYTKRNMKEKEAYLARKTKAQQLLNDYETAFEDYEKLKEAMDVITKFFVVGDRVVHSKYGEGIVKAVDGTFLVTEHHEKESRASLPVMIANGILSSDKKEYTEIIEKYLYVLKKRDFIPVNLTCAEQKLAPYAEYLD